MESMPKTDSLYSTVKITFNDIKENSWIVHDKA